MAVITVRPSQRFKGRWEVGYPGYPIETRKSKRGAISWAKGWKKPGDEIKVVENPGAFERCVKSVKARGSAYDPRAVCATAGRKKYGQAEMTRRAIAGKRRAARGNPEDDEPRAFFKERNDGKYSVQFVYPRSGSRVNKILTREKFEEMKASGKYHVYHSSRGNPASAAAEAYERFHGEPPSRITTVTRTVHHHDHLWSVGTLKHLTILTVDQTAKVKLKSFRGAFLAANEQAFADLSRTGKARAQLFIEGGDQSIDLADFGIDPDRSHEVETLGRATAVHYETNKVHLGDEGGEAVYEHKFRRTRKGDAEVKVRWARYPDVIYRVLDQHLEFSGGSYELIAEGINL